MEIHANSKINSNYFYGLEIILLQVYDLEYLY